jgi:hypothetical protein
VKIIGWLRPRRDAWLLQAIMFLLSVGQGMALVDVSLEKSDFQLNQN